MGCCLGVEERGEHDALLANDIPQTELRPGREQGSFGKYSFIEVTFKYVGSMVGLWKPTGCGLVISFLLALICIFQLVYDLFVVCRCPGFDCGFLEKPLHSNVHKHMNDSHEPFRKTSQTVYTLACIGGCFSYTLLLMCLLMSQRRRRKYNNKAIQSSDSIDDLSNTQITRLFSSLVFALFLFLTSVGLFYYIAHTQPRDGWYFYLMMTGVAAQFIAQWAAIVACHVFAIPTLALGTLANDTIRRIEQINDRTRLSEKAKRKAGKRALLSAHIPARSAAEGRPRSASLPTRGAERESIGSALTKSTNQITITNRKFDIALEYHEDLCAIVSDTVSAYCPWFIVHWFCYGATCLIGVIYTSEMLAYYDLVSFASVYVSLLVVTHIYLFLFPCCIAAYITDTCGGIYTRINETKSTDWNDQHPFRERAQLMMFTSYVKDRQCVFKIGRVTFTSSLAWISLLIGSAGLLFHFF